MTHILIIIYPIRYLWIIIKNNDFILLKTYLYIAIITIMFDNGFING